MIVRTAKDLGLLLRNRRRELKLSQAELATRIGVTRQWIIEIERGKPRAEIGLLLSAVRALQLDLDIRNHSHPQRPRPRAAAAVDLDAILDRARSTPTIPETARATSGRKRGT